MNLSTASFRDPDGTLYQLGDRVFRRVDAMAPVLVQDDPLMRCLEGLQAAGHWIPAHPAPPDALQALQSSGLLGTISRADKLLEHPRIFFPSYPHEWCPSMLAAAGKHTLAVSEVLLEAGFELKDGTPTNVLFEGPRPIFVDHLSPVRRKPGQLGWTAYGQFVRTFLIPLMLQSLKGFPLSWMYLARRDGIAPEEAARRLTIFDLLRPSIFGLVTLPTVLARLQGTSSPSRGIGASKAENENLGLTVTRHILKGLDRRLQHWVPKTSHSTFWSRYDKSGESYTKEGLEEKEEFVCHALETCRPRSVIDLGCNTGRYSRLAAKLGARVIAVDADVDCIEQVWAHSVKEGLDILPLIIDLGRPSPSLGWENKEESSFLTRVAGRFEMVIALALVHHLLVRERVDLAKIVNYLARQTTRYAIIEWVPPKDPQFLKLAGPNRDLYTHFDRESFETALHGNFRILTQSTLTGGERTIYLLEKDSIHSIPPPHLD